MHLYIRRKYGHKHTRIYARAHACRGWKSKRGETAEYKGRDQGKQ